MQYTIYTAGAIMGNINKYTAREVDVTFEPYAQYPTSAVVKFLPPRKRKWRQFRATPSNGTAFAVVLKGDGPNMPDPFDPVDRSGPLPTQRSTYTAFDRRYETDASEVLDAWLKDHPHAVIFDGRQGIPLPSGNPPVIVERIDGDGPTRQFTNDQGRVFLFRVVKPGYGHGRNDELVNDGETLVEVYDHTYTGEDFGSRGQFVSKYYLDTLTRLNGTGLDLYGGVDKWKVDGRTMDDVRGWLRTHG